MTKELEILENSQIVINYNILDFKYGKNYYYYLKIKAILINNSELFIRLFVSDTEYIYSFHWKNDKNTYIRWDNAPHYKNVTTYPHHKHINDQVTESYEICLEDVLKYIEKEINKG